jgi:hypothetical protein
MRAKDLLLERDYLQDLRSEVITLLATVSAEGIDEVDTDNLLNDLASQGYAIDKSGLVELLSTMDIVSTASDDKIQIATSDADAMVGMDSGEFEQDRVDDLATNQATKDMGESINDIRRLAGLLDENGEVIQGPWARPQKMSMSDAFGQEEYRAIKDAGYLFSEKPAYLSDISATIPRTSLAKLQRLLGRKFDIIKIHDLLPYRAGEYYPQTTPKIQMASLPETIIVHDVDNSTYYLVNKTGAQSYWRMWAKIK